jgi:hypothetical protein
LSLSFCSCLCLSWVGGYSWTLWYYGMNTWRWVYNNWAWFNVYHNQIWVNYIINEGNKEWFWAKFDWVKNGYSFLGWKNYQWASCYYKKEECMILGRRIRRWAWRHCKWVWRQKKGYLMLREWDIMFLGPKRQRMGNYNCWAWDKHQWTRRYNNGIRRIKLIWNSSYQDWSRRKFIGYRRHFSKSWRQRDGFKRWLNGLWGWSYKIWRNYVEFWRNYIGAFNPQYGLRNQFLILVGLYNFDRDLSDEPITSQSWKDLLINWAGNYRSWAWKDLWMEELNKCGPVIIKQRWLIWARNVGGIFLTIDVGQAISSLIHWTKEVLNCNGLWRWSVGLKRWGYKLRRQCSRLRRKNIGFKLLNWGIERSRYNGRAYVTVLKNYGMSPLVSFIG